jgi:hypothetical protein
MKTIETTRNKAIAKSKQIIRNEAGAERVFNYLIRDSYIRCACGDSYAVYVTAIINDILYTANVGVCRICGRGAN